MEPTAESPASRRIKPHQLALGLGAVIAIVTVISGIAGAWLQFHDESPTTREVFENIPSPLRLAFYTAVPIVLLYGAVLFSQRMRNWERGAPESRARPR